jgi:hypothetical protein
MSRKVIKVMLTNIPQQKGQNLSLCTTWVKDYLHCSNVLTVQFEVTGFAVIPIVFILKYRLTIMHANLFIRTWVLKLHVTTTPLK